MHSIDCLPTKEGIKPFICNGRVALMATHLLQSNEFSATQRRARLLRVRANRRAGRI